MVVKRINSSLVLRVQQLPEDGDTTDVQTFYDIYRTIECYI
jgi:hypothetical protein